MPGPAARPSVTLVARALLALALVAPVAACQGSGSSSGTAGSGAVGSGSARGAGSAGGSAEPPAEPPARVVEPAPEAPPDPSVRIADLGAIPAWQAVIDRGQLLARRGQKGVVFGRIGPAVMVPDPAPPPLPPGTPPPKTPPMIASPYVWLVDDTEGNGALAIRVRLGDRAAATGARVALRGAWTLDEARRWVWAVDDVEPLPPAPPSTIPDPVAPVPGHAITLGELPPRARTISLAKDGDAVYFQIVGPRPANEGDGWAVADELGNPPFALMNLPGERSSYGGQDMRAADERWTLKRGVTYWVRIGKLRKRTDKPALVTARTAPIKVQ